MSADGRQFRNAKDEATTRDKQWFLELMRRYADKLERASAVVADALRFAHKQLAAADLPKLVADGKGDNELDALLKLLVPHLAVFRSRERGIFLLQLKEG